MRIDAFGMRHMPVKPDPMDTKASVDMNLQKQKSMQEQRDLEERLRKQREEDEKRQLTAAESKARAAAGGQQKKVRTHEEAKRFQMAVDADNLLRQAMLASAQAYVETRDRMRGKANEFLKANPQFIGLESGDGPAFELRGAAADPTWRFGRGAPPQGWDILAWGERFRLVDWRSGQLRSEWDGARWLGKDLTQRLVEAGQAGKLAVSLVRVRWQTDFPSLQDCAAEIYDKELRALDASQAEVVRRYKDEISKKAQESLREQPMAMAENARGPVALLGLVEGKLAPVEMRDVPKPAPAQPEAGMDAREQFAMLLEASAYEEASELLLSVSAVEVEASQRGEPASANQAVELLKLARDHIQKFGADAAATLVATSRQVIEDQRRARAGR